MLNYKSQKHSKELINVIDLGDLFHWFLFKFVMEANSTFSG